jgi:hypothetical protein
VNYWLDALKIQPFDALGPTVGSQALSFSYVDTGGPGQLAPGRVVTQSTAVNWPSNARTAQVLMTGFGAAFVDGDNHLTDHHLGDIVLQFFFPNNTSVACNFLLRDQGIDEGVNMWANGVVLFFG